LDLLVAGIVHRRTRPWALFMLVGLIVFGVLAVGWTTVSWQPGAPVIEHLNGDQWQEELQPASFDHSYTTHKRSVTFDVGLLGPLLLAAILLGIVALIRHARGPAALLAVVLIPLCGIFFLRGSYHREVYSSSDATVSEVPLEVRSYSFQATETPITLAEEEPDAAAAHAAAGEALVEMVEA